MKTAFMLGFLPSLWAFSFGIANVGENLSLLVIFYTWTMISWSYFLHSLIRVVFVKKNGGNLIRYKLKNWFLFGIVLGAGINETLRAASAIFTVMYVAI
jgi:hypothetical protein